MHNNPIFIVGVGRSGTTLIRQMINSHSQIAIPYESHFITKYLAIEEEYGDLSNDHNLTKLVDDILAEPILNDWDYKVDKDTFYSSIEVKTLGGVFDTFYRLYAKHHGKPRWGDKSDYLDRMYQIKALYPGAKFIHIVRDGRDVAMSVMKMTWGPTNIKEAAEWWGEYVRLGYSMGRMLTDEFYHEVRYEDLVAEPKTKLKKICEFIGVAFEDKMLDFFKDSKKFIPQTLLDQHYNADRAADASRSAAWKKEMSPVDCEIFQQIAGDVLAEMKYEIVDNNVPSWHVKLAKLKIMGFG